MLTMGISALLRKHVQAAGGRFGYRLDHVPVFDDLAVDHTEDVHHCRP